MRLCAVVLAGGRGERFWPLSRRSRPKQLLPLLGARPMLALTLDRLQGLVAPEDVWIFTARDLAPQVREAAPGVPAKQIIGEPVGKNTAPAIALAAWWLQGAGEDTAIAVLPSDHRIEPSERLREDLARAARAALERSAIVTFGIPPTRPETGYGYIETGDAIAARSEFHSVRAFREKPDLATATRYFEDGRHLWNAGMFVFPPRVILDEIRAHCTDIAALLSSVPSRPEEGTDAILERFYRAAPAISIDYAVMERSKRALVARAGFAWDDVGSWAALATAGPLGPEGNVVRGEALLHDCRDVIAFSEGGLVAGVGVQDLVIVRTDDVTLVCRRDRAQEVRAIVERIKERRDLDGYL